jgi:hypothetical protein
MTWRSHPKVQAIWAELEDTKERLADEEHANKIWDERYRELSKHLNKATLGGETSVWKDSYRSLLILHGRPPVEGAKEVLADKLDKLEKEVQEHRRTMNMFIGSDAYRDHEIVEAYVQIWKEIDAKPDRNRWLEALTEMHTRIRAMARGDEPEETPRYYRSFIQEVPPKGSKFTKDGGYVTPDGGYITPSLRMEFRSLQRSYDTRNPRNDPSKKVDPEDYQFVGQPSKN